MIIKQYLAMDNTDKNIYNREKFTHMYIGGPLLAVIMEVYFLVVNKNATPVDLTVICTYLGLNGQRVNITAVLSLCILKGDVFMIKISKCRLHQSFF